MPLGACIKSDHTLSPVASRREDAGLAQLVERMICNLEVAGSTPAAGTIWALDEFIRV